MGSHRDDGEECISDRRSKDYWHCSKGLNIETKKYDENQKDGLLICGINWGGKPPKDPNGSVTPQKPPSFFSDLKNKYRYKTRIVNWFKLLGHPLCRKAGEESGFERSLLQTNWIADQSVDTSKMNLPADFYNAWPNFKCRLGILQPKLIIFFSVQMLDALNSVDCARKAKIPFGSTKQKCSWSGKPGELHVAEDDFDIKYRVGCQKFDEVNIIALPHPSTPFKNSYIEAYKDVLSPIICQYKAARKFELPARCKRLWLT